MRAKDEAYRILEAALSIASAGVDEAEVGLRGGTAGFVRFTDSQIDPQGQVAREALTVRLARHGRWARSTTSDFSAEGITEAAQTARAELDRLPEGVVGDGLPSPQGYPEIEAFDEATADVGALERTATAARVLTAAYRSEREVAASGALTITRGGLQAGFPKTYALANTRGLLAYHPSTRAELEVHFDAPGRRGRAMMSRTAVEDLDARSTIERALWSATHGDADPRPLPPGRYPAVLDRAAIARLLKVLGDTAGLARLRRGDSFLAERLGEALLDPRVSILDDFSHPLHRGVPFDSRGVARRSVLIVDEGALRGPVVSWSSSVRFEQTCTGHGRESPVVGDDEGADYLVMAGGQGDTDRLLGLMRTGVLITDFDEVVCLDPRSLRVAGVTAGGAFAVEGAEVTVPLLPMRFELSIVDLLRNFVDFGSADWAEGVVAPPLFVAEMPLYAWA